MTRLTVTPAALFELLLRDAGIDVQVNATVTRLNAPYLDDLVALALELGAVAFHPFFLVPTGRGKGLEKEELGETTHRNCRRLRDD